MAGFSTRKQFSSAPSPHRTFGPRVRFPLKTHLGSAAQIQVDGTIRGLRKQREGTETTGEPSLVFAPPAPFRPGRRLLVPASWCCDRTEFIRVPRQRLKDDKRRSLSEDGGLNQWGVPSHRPITGSISNPLRQRRRGRSLPGCCGRRWRAANWLAGLPPRMSNRRAWYELSKVR